MEEILAFLAGMQIMGILGSILLRSKLLFALAFIGLVATALVLLESWNAI